MKKAITFYMNEELGEIVETVAHLGFSGESTLMKIDLLSDILGYCENLQETLMEDYEDELIEIADEINANSSSPLFVQGSA